jgi:serine/threonine protein kinase
MSPDPRRVKELFDATLNLKAGLDRKEFLDRECADDPELRERLKALLHAHDQAQPALDQPLVVVGSQATEEESGTILAGKYRLIEKIGAGGMGSVWMALQTGPVKRTVAVKFLKADVDSQAILLRFEAERQTLALMDHPNIARVLDGGTTQGGRPFFVMEMVKGIPITDYCDQRKLTPRQRLELFLPVCQAIQHAHQKSIIHRDIKPSNVLVALYDEQPVPKVIDFGVAKVLGLQVTDPPVATDFGTIVGTPEYMSPEQAMLFNLDIDTRSDIYSLGVLLYELLTGSPPFSRKELEQTGRMDILGVIRDEEPPRPSIKLSTAEALPTLAINRGTEPLRLTRQLRGEIDWIVMKALEKERSDRYATANDLALDIQRYLADEPVAAGPPSAAYRLKKFVKRHKGQVVAAGLVILAFLGGMVGTTIGLVLAETQRRDAIKAQRAEADRAEGERLAKLDAQKSAEAEKEAKEQAQKRLKQIENGTEILASVFHNIDPNSEEQEVESLRVLLGKRLGEAVQQLEGEAVGDPLLVARLQALLGASLRELGHYQQAEVVLVKALRTQESDLGVDHPKTLATKNHLAILFMEQGKYPQAETLFKEILDLNTAKLNADHPDVLNIKNNLALLFKSQGRYPQAEMLFKEVLDASIASRGDADCDTLNAKNNLAALYQAEGKYTEAQKLFEEVLEIRTARQGADHPETLSAKNNLAWLYHAQGMSAEAETLFKEVLEVSTKQLGADHPHTLSTKNNLAVLYQSQKKYPQAESLLNELLETAVAKLGADHPQTLAHKNNLAVLFQAQRKYERAETLFKEVLDGRTSKLGGDHPATLSSKHNLAGLYKQQRRFAEAERLFKDVLDRRTAKLGADHPSTLTTENTLAALYHAQGKYPQAERLFKKVLEERSAKLGADHPSTLTTRANLADVYRAEGKYPEAETLLKEVLQVQTTNLGADHASTLTTRNNLAALYAKMKQTDRSIQLFEELHELQKKKYGPNHPGTLLALANLGVSYRDASRIDDAVRCLEDAFTTIRRAPLPIPDDLIWVPGALAQTYDQAKQYAKSEPIYRTVMILTRKEFGVDDPRTADSMARLTRNLLAQKKHAEAETLARECLAIRARKQADEWVTFYTRSLLGEILLAQKKYTDAEPLLRDGYNGLKQRQAKMSEPARTARLTEALTHLVQLYEATDNKDEAAKWRKELSAMSSTDWEPSTK